MGFQWIRSHGCLVKDFKESYDVSSIGACCAAFLRRSIGSDNGSRNTARIDIWHQIPFFHGIWQLEAIGSGIDKRFKKLFGIAALQKRNGGGGVNKQKWLRQTMFMEASPIVFDHVCCILKRSITWHRGTTWHCLLKQAARVLSLLQTML